MANALYVKGAERMFAASLQNTAPVAGALKAALVKTAYAQNLSTDEFFTAISANVVGTPQALTGITVTGGKLTANNPTFAAVAAGDTVKAIVLYVDTGVAGTSWLFAYIDTVTGFPMATNGGDITPQWDTGTYKIVSLV